jgi:hypothetical protein
MSVYGFLYAVTIVLLSPVHHETHPSGEYIRSKHEVCVEAWDRTEAVYKAESVYDEPGSYMHVYVGFGCHNVPTYDVNGQICR